MLPDLEIKEKSFINCKGLKKITYNSNHYSLNILNFKTQSSITKIGISAFALCHSLTEVCLTPSITIIEKYAFNGSSIKSLSILSSYIELKKRMVRKYAKANQNLY